MKVTSETISYFKPREVKILLETKEDLDIWKCFLNYTKYNTINKSYKALVSELLPHFEE